MMIKNYLAKVTSQCPVVHSFPFVHPSLYVHPFMFVYPSQCHSVFFHTVIPNEVRNLIFIFTIMHEMSIALSIVEAVEAKARKEGAGRISGIDLVIGKLAGIEPESLKFCFSAAAKGTLAEEALLAVDEPEGLGECGECGAMFPVSFYYAECPVCRSLRVKIVSGEEFVIKSITIEDQEGE